MVSNERKHTVGVFCGLLNGVICELSTLKKKKKNAVNCSQISG
jgi:hypothetical protein